MRRALLVAICLLAGCGAAPETGVPIDGDAAAVEPAGENSADYEAALRAAEEERRSAGPVVSRREPQFAPVDKDRLTAMVGFLPNWKLEFSDHFAMLHQLDPAVAAGLLQAAEKRTLAAFRSDPRASEIVTPLLRCVADRDVYGAYGGSPDAPATYSEERNEILLLADPQAGQDSAALLGDAIDRWFKATSPREIEKRLRFLQEWADRRRSGR